MFKNKIIWIMNPGIFDIHNPFNHAFDNIERIGEGPDPNKKYRVAFDSFVAHHIEYPPYKNRIYSICYPDGNIQIAKPQIGWPRATFVCDKYYFDEIFFHLHLYAGKITTKSTSDRYSSIITLARNSDATSTLMTVLVDRLKLYLKPAANGI